MLKAARSRKADVRSCVIAWMAAGILAGCAKPQIDFPPAPATLQSDAGPWIVGAGGGEEGRGPEPAKTGPAAAASGAGEMLSGSAGLFADGGMLGFALWVVTAPVFAAIGAAEAGSKARSQEEIEAAARRIAAKLAKEPLVAELRWSVSFEAEQQAGRQFLACPDAATPMACTVAAGSESEIRVLWLEAVPLAWCGMGTAYDPLIGFRARVKMLVVDGSSGDEVFRWEYRHINRPVSFFAGDPKGMIDCAADSLAEAIVADLLGGGTPEQPDPLWTWQPQGTTWIVDERHVDRFLLASAPEWYR